MKRWRTEERKSNCWRMGKYSRKIEFPAGGGLDLNGA